MRLAIPKALPKYRRSNAQHVPLARMPVIRTTVLERSAEVAAERAPQNPALFHAQPGGAENLRKEVRRGVGRPVAPPTSLRRPRGNRVRVHTDRRADALTRRLGAGAVTAGDDVLFRDGLYRPETSSCGTAQRRERVTGKP